MKLTRSILVIAVLAIFAWGGALLVVGPRLGAELENFEIALARSGEIVVHRFDYEDGFRDGQLHYDLEWSPSPGSAWYEFVIAVREFSPDGVRLTGTARFIKGPWVGGEVPLALARMDLAYPLPDELRRSLPQYPSGEPLLAITSVLGFDGVAHSLLRVTDYDGSVVLDNDSGNLQLHGLAGELALNSALTRLNGVLNLDRFAIGNADAEFDLENLGVTLGVPDPGPALALEFLLGGVTVVIAQSSSRFAVESVDARGTSRRVDPGVWLGNSEGGIGRIAVQTGATDFELQAATSASGLALDDAGLMVGTNVINVGQIRLGSGALENSALALSVRNLSPRAYADLLRLGAGDGSADLAQDFTNILNELLDARPTINVDRLALSVVGTGDLTATLSIGYDGDVPVDLNTPEMLVDGLAVQGSFAMSTMAARRLIEMALSAREDAPTGVDLAAAVEESYESLVNFFADSELFVITDTSISSSLQVSGGEVLVNGNAVMEVADLAGLLPGGGSRAATGIMPAGDLPEFDTVARVENVMLVNGFDPDPHKIILEAGGDSPAMTVLGADCFGSVFSTQPDIILSYVAGPSFDLTLFAESDQDTTLVVLTPQGWICDDDSYGNYNPAVLIESPESGDYLIWVGTFDGGTAVAELGITEN